MMLPFPKCFDHSSGGYSDDDSDSTREEQRQTEGTGERERETERVWTERETDRKKDDLVSTEVDLHMKS